MFPTTVRRKRNDEFAGELIRPDEYLRAEERGKIRTGMRTPMSTRVRTRGWGKKQKWDDVGVASKPALGPDQAPQPTRTMSADELEAAALANGPGGDELDNLEEQRRVRRWSVQLVASTTTLTVNLRIAFVDFSGLHDKRSLNMYDSALSSRANLF